MTCYGYTTHLGLLIHVNRPTQDKNRDVVFRCGVENVVGHRDQFLGPNNKTRLLQRLAFSTRKVAFSQIQVAAGELPGACDAVLVSAAT